MRVFLWLRLLGLDRFVILLLEDLNLIPEDVDLLLRVQKLIDVLLAQGLNLIKDLFVILLHHVILVEDLLKLLKSVFKLLALEQFIPEFNMECSILLLQLLKLLLKFLISMGYLV